MTSTLLGPAVGYVDLLDETLTKKSTADATKARKFNPLRPSSAGKCAHELATEYAQYKGFAPSNSEVLKPELQRIFSLGHSIEYHILRMFEENAIADVKYRQQVVRMFKLSDDSWIEGSLDMTFFINGKGGIGDVKSKKDRLSGFSATGWDEANEGYANMQSVERVTEKLFWINDLDAFLDELKDPYLAPNFLQLNLYANSDFIKESNIDHCFLVYYNKNDSRLREMRFRPSVTVFEKVRAKFNMVHDHIIAGGSASELRCDATTFCRYCWPDESLKAFYATLPPKKWAKDTSYLGQTGKTLENIYKDYKEAKGYAGTASTFEDALLKVMNESKETKVKFSDGLIYEAKFLKSPKPHFELRRAK